MFFQSRTFHVAKDAGFAEEYEDAFCVDGERGTAAIADGVSSAIFSALWAQILTRALVEAPPNVHDADAFKAWLTERRAEWLAGIDLPNMGYFQKTKLRQVGGAFCTLCWLQVYPDADQVDALRYRVYALGDSCLFHVRDGELLQSFPLRTAAEFDLDPAAICSADLGRDHALDFPAIDEACAPGDLLILATDAVAKCLLAEREAGGVIDWSRYATLHPLNWLAEIEEQRNDRRIRRDDSTIVWIRVGDEPLPEVEEPPVAPPAVEEMPVESVMDAEETPVEAAVEESSAAAESEEGAPVAESIPASDVEPTSVEEAAAPLEITACADEPGEVSSDAPADDKV
ncbi:MAG TPA: hypothetical protein VHB77_20865 [Planctomycetaceae bacterium]|nr:hypothetical protein [Planctomycetaceae bacterium]